MASYTHQDRIDFCKEIVRMYEPYSLDVFDRFALDGEERGVDVRYAATIALKALLDAGFSEDEANPWKKSPKSYRAPLAQRNQK